MRLLYKGAEAELWRTEYLGIPAVMKKRFRKKFILPELDERIRFQRIRRECLMLSQARRAVRTPFVLAVDKRDCSFLMEFIPGEKVRDLFYKGEKLGLSEEIGKKIRGLHELDIIHGDLTTSNMILEEKGELCFIDFGLAFKSAKEEDKATDLLVFKRMIYSTHPEHADTIWSGVCKGYSDEKVLAKVEEIESRARYL